MGACGARAASTERAASERRGRLEMSDPQERQAGRSGSSTGYEQGQPRGQEYEGRSGRYETERAGERGADRDYAPAGRRAGEHRGAVVAFTAVGGTLLILGGLWGVIVGLTGLSTNHVFWTNPGTGYTYAWTNHGWGWLELIIGIVMFAAGVGVFLGIPFARYFGAFVAVVAAISHFMLIPFTPIWSIVMIAIDAFIIWALLSPRRTTGEF
jgi:hypothetical protein